MGANNKAQGGKKQKKMRKIPRKQMTGRQGGLAGQARAGRRRGGIGKEKKMDGGEETKMNGWEKKMDGGKEKKMSGGAGRTGLMTKIYDLMTPSPKGGNNSPKKGHKRKEPQAAAELQGAICRSKGCRN